MKHISKILLLISIALASCQQTSPIPADQIAWEETMESKDFWEYSEFIQAHPESQYFDTALGSYFFYRNKLWDSVGVPMGDCFFDCISISMINDSSIILFEHELLSLDTLKQYAFDFLSNASQDPTKPRLRPVKIPKTDSIRLVTKGFFEIKFHPETRPYSKLQKTVSIISRSIQDYKNYLSLDWYNKEYKNLETENREVLDSLLARRLIFWELEKTPTLPQMTFSTWCVQGNTLANRIDFTTVKHVKLRNAKGPHHLTSAQWNTLKPEIENAKCIQGLICKPKWLSIWFEFENGEVIDGYFCGKFLNFDRADITGSFELSSEINLENY